MNPKNRDAYASPWLYASQHQSTNITYSGFPRNLTGMNSRDILDGFLSDAAFSSACTKEKFARECASSLSPETSAKIYDLISEQHQHTMKTVKGNVFAGGFLSEIPTISKDSDITENSEMNESSGGSREESTSVPYLIRCLLEATKTSESHSEILQEQISEQLDELKIRKKELSTLVNAATDLQQLPLASTNQLAEKCIVILQK